MRHLVFLLGLVAAGLCLGWLVGGSTTPVAGAAIPVVFGAVAAVFAALAGLGKISVASFLPKADAGKVEPAPALDAAQENEKYQKALARERSVWRENHRETISLFGGTLLFFFLGFGGGLLAGAKARIEGWFHPPAIASLPWSTGNKPGSLAQAIEWIGLAEQLAARGYTPEKISEVLATHREPPAGKLKALPWERAPASVEEGAQRLLLAEFLHQSGYSEEAIKAIQALPWGEEAVMLPSPSTTPTESQAPASQPPPTTVSTVVLPSPSPRSPVASVILGVDALETYLSPRSPVSRLEPWGATERAVELPIRDNAPFPTSAP